MAAHFHCVRVRTLACALLVALVGVGSAASVFASGAVAEQHIAVSPYATKLSIAAGRSTNGSFEVVNEGSAAFDISVFAAPYHVEGTDYDPQFTSLPGTTDASSWVQIAGTTKQSLAAHKLTKLSYTLTIPHGTAPGGYYAVLFAETVRTANSSGVVSRSRVGDVLYITVQGPVKIGGDIQAVSIPRFTMASSLPLAMLVSNTGGIHFLTDATMTAKNIFGKDVFRSSTRRYVLPQTVRRISAVWQATPAIGLFRIERGATVAGLNRQLPSQWLVVVHPWVIGLTAVVVLVTAIGVMFRRSLSKSRSRD